MGFWVLMIGKLKGILACIEVKTLEKVAFTKLPLDEERRELRKRLRDL